MTNSAVANFLQELNAAGVESLTLTKEGNKVLCTMYGAAGSGWALSHFHVRASPANLAATIVQAVNQASTLTNPLTTDGT